MWAKTWADFDVDQGRLFFIFIVSEVNSRLLCLKMFVQVAA